MRLTFQHPPHPPPRECKPKALLSSHIACKSPLHVLPHTSPSSSAPAPLVFLCTVSIAPFWATHHPKRRNPKRAPTCAHTHLHATPHGNPIRCWHAPQGRQTHADSSECEMADTWPFAEFGREPQGTLPFIGRRFLAFWSALPAATTADVTSAWRHMGIVETSLHLVPAMLPHAHNYRLPHGCQVFSATRSPNRWCSQDTAHKTGRSWP